VVILQQRVSALKVYHQGKYFGKTVIELYNYYAKMR